MLPDEVVQVAVPRVLQHHAQRLRGGAHPEHLRHVRVLQLVQRLRLAAELVPVSTEVYLLFVVVVLLTCLATSQVISRRISTCDSAHSWRLYSGAPLGNQATTMIMTQHPIQSHFPDARLTSPGPIILMPSARLGSERQVSNLIKSLV